MKKYLKKSIIHYNDQEVLISSFGRHIFLYDYNKKKQQKIRLPFCFPRDLHFGIHPLKRLLRSDAKEVIYDKISKKLIVIRDSKIYRISDNKFKILGTIKGDAPLFNSHCIHKGIIYFGQYDQNHSRKKSSIYKININDKLEIAHTFNAGKIRHVHSISNDIHIKNRLWVSTGDNDGECLLAFTDDNFKTINNLGDLSQGYRIVNIGFARDHIFYGTDSLIKKNHLYVQNRQSGLRQKILKINQTAWFLKQDNAGNAILGTTVENGDGCQVNYSSIFFSKDFGLSWIELLRIPKDIYPMPLFKWGTVSFSNIGDSIDDLFINFEGLKHLSGFSVSIKTILNFGDDELRKIEIEKKRFFENNQHLMITIYRLFMIYKNNRDIRYLNVLLKCIDIMPLKFLIEKKRLKKEAIGLYESINYSTN